jgi:uncharacterized protein
MPATSMRFGRPLLMTLPWPEPGTRTGGRQCVLPSTARSRRKQEVADVLLEAKPDLDVFDAAAAGDVDRLTELLDGDPDLIGTFSEDGYTPLHFAAFFDRGKALRLLLDRGADVGAVAKNDMQVQPLHSAVAANSREIVAALLTAGADPNAKQQGGFTPLMAAEENEKEGDMVRLLMDHGAEESATAPTE